VKKVFWLSFGIANTVLGMNLDFRVDQGSFGMVRICECNTQESRELSPNDSINFQGFAFCNFERGLALKQNNLDDHFGSIKIYAEKSLSIESVTADSCVIFSPNLIIAGQCEIAKLTAQKNVSLKEGSNLVSKQINFQPSNWDLCCFFIDSSAELRSDELRINGDRVTVKNYGSMVFDKLEIDNFGRESSIDFLQYGSLVANLVEQKGRMFQNRGQTRINKYNLITSTTLEIENGNFRVDLLKGNIRALKFFDPSRSFLGRIEGHVGYARNRSASVEVEEIDTDNPIILNSREGASTRVAQANPMGMVIASNANTSIDRAHVRELSARGSADVNVTNSEVESLNVSDRAKAWLDNSSFRNVSNRSESEFKDSNIDRLINLGKAFFDEQNHVNTTKNYGYIRNDGIAYMDRYKGYKNSVLETAGTSERTISNLNDDYPIVHLASDAVTYARRMDGEGKVIAPKQFYFGHMLQGFELRGNVDVFLDYMPEETEISKHVGEFKVHVNLTEDYVNESNKKYGDVIFFVDMNGFNWKNIESDFKAGGLAVQNAGVFENYNGRISLQDFLSVQAERILNAATPTERKSSSVHFHMPATYFLRNREKGISTGEGGICFKATDSIINEFSNIVTDGGIYAEADNDFRNTVGKIQAELRSQLKGKNIYNESREPNIKKGEFHFSGKQSRKIWHYDLYVAELVNQSEGAKMIFRDGVDIKGDEIHVIGSKIVGGDINIDCQIQDFQSVLDNIAEIGGKVYLNGSKIQGVAMRLWSIEDNEEE
jgi:hypothetical protein